MIKDIFEAPDLTALTVTPSHPLKSFWQPEYTPPGTDPTTGKLLYEGFGDGVDRSNFGVNIFNESNLFHEALHGFTNYIDQDLYGVSPYNGPLPGVGPPSVNISIYIKDKILSKCASFR